MVGQRIFQTVAVGLALSALSVLVAVTLTWTDGMLVYSLDDPYIHLAVAENILQGSYGVNTGEFSAPSSSALYPFLLAALLALGFGEWSPLLLGGLGAALTAWLLAGALWKYAVAPGSWRGLAFAAVVLVPMLLAINIVALPMTGMEHTLHVAATVAIVLGLYELSRYRPVPAWFILAAIFAPLIRYEGLALAVPSFFALLWYRKFASAVFLAVALGVILGGFALLLIQNGMPPLPSSVMVKSEAVASALGARFEETSILDSLRVLTKNALHSYYGRYGTIFGFAIVMLTLGLATRISSEDTRRVILWLAVSFALLGHAFIGRFGWFSRYEIYAMAMLITALTAFYSDFWRNTDTRFLFKTLGAVLFLGLLAGDYLLTTIKSPAASQNIYIQQFQMHRFATDYFPKTVAVNDLGYVSYQNKGYVLDLGGLGSEEARRAASVENGLSAEIIRRLAASRDAKYAMVYIDGFRDIIPAEWCHVATLKTVKVTAAEANVGFFLIDPALGIEMMGALDAFGPTLPEPASLDRFSC